MPKLTTAKARIKVAAQDALLEALYAKLRDLVDAAPAAPDREHAAAIHVEAAVQIERIERLFGKVGAKWSTNLDSCRP